MKQPSIFIIEGIDRLGKSTLINGINSELGFHNVIHSSKPALMKAYGFNARAGQHAAFKSAFELMWATRGTCPIIFDRLHLGEIVYGPYRGYSGEYVLDIEKEYGLDQMSFVKLVLMTTSNVDIMTDDGESHDFSRREHEQQIFMHAFNESIIVDKIMIDVHDGMGGYRNAAEILSEVIK